MLLTDALQDIYDAANYTYRHGDGEAAVDELAARIRGLLDHCEKSTEEFHAVLLSVYERRIVNGEADDDETQRRGPRDRSTTPFHIRSIMSKGCLICTTACP